VFTVVEVPVGIILLVHPRVNGDGQITLRVKPVVSTVSGFVDGVPQTSTREAETVVRVKDGDTLVIGGLIRDEDVKTMTKVPILGDLPLVGQLFRYHERNHRRSEVMIFLTIKMVN
jgi:type II secretory pathway component GspD/PulD (secretin)